MCGLLGEYSFSTELTNPKEFGDLLELSVHRGPDSTKTYVDKKFQLGFNRLALLDLSAEEEKLLLPTKRKPGACRPLHRCPPRGPLARAARRLHR